MFDFLAELGDQAQAQAVALRATNDLSTGYSLDRQPMGYQNYTGAFATRGVELTGNDEWLTVAKEQLEQIRQMFALYEELPGHEKGLEGFGGSLLHGFSEVQVEGRNGYLSYNSSSAGAAYLAVPSTLWALSGFPDGSDYEACKE